MCETGIDNVLRFDFEAAIFGEYKSVKFRYETSFVIELGSTVETDELNEHREKCHRSPRKVYENAYTAELKDLYGYVLNRKVFKTLATDAVEGVKLFTMMMDKHPEHNGQQAGGDGIARLLLFGP